MQRTLRTPALLAAFAAMLAGLTLSTATSPALAAGTPKAMPPIGCGSGC